MQKNVLCIKNGDARQQYLARMMEEDGYRVTVCDTVCSDFGEYDVVLLPMLSQQLDLERIAGKLRSGQKVFGGMFPAFFEEACMAKGVCCYDYTEEETIAVKNALATAEGAIAEAICLGDENLHGSRSLVIGFGRCGKILADRLLGLHSLVTVLETDEEKRTQASVYGFETKKSFLESEDYAYLFNTAPSFVLDREGISHLREGTVIIDIASGGGMADHEYCREKGIREKRCPGLPGRYAPKSSARILYEYVVRVCV